MQSRQLCCSRSDGRRYQTAQDQDLLSPGQRWLLSLRCSHSYNRGQKYWDTTTHFSLTVFPRLSEGGAYSNGGRLIEEIRYNLSFCFSGFCLNDRFLATPSSLSMLFTVSNIMYFHAYLPFISVNID